MTMTVVASLLAITLAPGPALGSRQAADPPSVAGTWSVTVKGQGAHGDMPAELALKQDGRKVTGTLTAHGSGRAVEGEYAGGTLTLSTTAEDADHRLTLTARLEDDGTLDGYLSGPMGDLRWTASRAKSDR
jgi:hypothetical protein